MSEEKVHVHLCAADSLHPYECGGKCIHCQRKVTEHHKPDDCWLCYDTADDEQRKAFEAKHC